MSGANLAVVLGAGLWLAAAAGMARPALVAVGIVLVAALVVLTRWEPSVLRAGVMAVLVLLGVATGRGPGGRRALRLAVLLLLLADPGLAGALGFQLSIAATAGVLWAGPLATKALPPWVPDRARTAAGVTLGAQAAALPVLALAFGRLSPASLPANLLGLPLAAGTMLLGVAAAATAPAAPWLSGLACRLAEPFLGRAGRDRPLGGRAARRLAHPARPAARRPRRRAGAGPHRRRSTAPPAGHLARQADQADNAEGRITRGSAVRRRAGAGGSPVTGDRERVALACFLAIAVLAGGNAVGVRFSNRELDPLWGAGLRFSLAAVVMVTAMAVLRQPLPRGRALTGVLLFGALNFGANFALAYDALVRLHAGLGQTLLALVPLATLMLAVAQRQERLRLTAVVGTLLALAGIALVSQAPLRASVPPLSLLAAVGSAVCVAQAAVLVRRFPPVHPVTLNAVGMTTGAVLLVGGSLLAGEAIALPRRTATWAAIGYLVVVGSVVVFVLYAVMLRYWAASRSVYVFVLIPLVTVALSVWLDDEPLGLGLALGGLLVLGGVYVGALRPTRLPPSERGRP